MFAAAANPTPESRVSGHVLREILRLVRIVTDADWERGRFRAFRLTAVKHFVANEWDKAHALKRGGGQMAVPIDPVEAEAW